MSVNPLQDEKNKPNSALLGVHLAHVLEWANNEALRASCGQIENCENMTETHVIKVDELVEAA